MSFEYGRNGRMELDRWSSREPGKAIHKAYFACSRRCGSPLVHRCSQRPRELSRGGRARGLRTRRMAAGNDRAWIVVDGGCGAGRRIPCGTVCRAVAHDGNTVEFEAGYTRQKHSFFCRTFVPKLGLAASLETLALRWSKTPLPST